MCHVNVCYLSDLLAHNPKGVISYTSKVVQHEDEQDVPPVVFRYTDQYHGLPLTVSWHSPL